METIAGTNVLDELDSILSWMDSCLEAAPSVEKNNVTTAKKKEESEDKSFRPAVPPGHTEYSWSIPEQTLGEKYSKPKPKPEATKKQPAKAKGGQNENKGKKKTDHKQGKVQFENTDRRDKLLSIETKMQKLWSSQRAFEAEPNPGQDKFMCTFPFPYMNGYLHVGHGFSLSKCEFAASYERLKGKRVLFPFGFHCTGMPIPACAMKIDNEMQQFGNPPKFPVVEEKPQKQQPKKKKGKGKRKKGKLAKKTSKKKYQWQIMYDFGLQDEQIGEFCDAQKWLEYFPPECMEHLKRFGLKADFRRSFITTDKNPYFDRFIAWQFAKLLQHDKLFFGNRPSVFSERTMQVCADHDRASGEQVGPQNYTLIKMKILEGSTPYTEEKGDTIAELVKEGNLFIVCGTLRPETMYGQTNTFVLPEGDYIIVEMVDGEKWVCGHEAARNMSFQDMLAGERGEIPIVGRCKGWDLLGRKVQAPYAQYDYVHVLPLLTIKMDKATGCVTSVPSDAPDDYAALMDMKKDEKARKKYFITKEMVDPFEVVSVLHINPTEEYPELGDTSAASLCVAKKVKSQRDAKKLEEIKDICYQLGFSKGVMNIGKYTGEPVKFVKDKVKADMISEGLAAEYWEPEEPVMARTGDRCVVCFTDQWFLKYGEDEWQSKVREHVNNTMDFFTDRTKSEFQRIVEWLGEWACSREFGLGTKLPNDPRFVIESLSDSTIYMSYYTIAHHLQGNCDLEGTNSPIDPAWLTEEVFDYIYTNGPMPDSPIGAEKLTQMQREFRYWYPMDLRCSGKDLIGNHLTMSIYNHAAIWPEEPEMWPQTYWTNGHANLNGTKMSKSEGNFLTLVQAIEKLTADCTRFALADAGDSIEDANFSEAVANAAILELTTQERWMEDMWVMQNRSGAMNAFDRMFDAAMSQCVVDAERAYDRMRYKDALRASWYNMQKAKSFYVKYSDTWHGDLVKKFITTQLVIVSPIVPHWCEYMWQKLHNGSQGLVINQTWPVVEANYSVYSEFAFLQSFRSRFTQEFNKKEQHRKKTMKKKKEDIPPFNACMIYVADSYYDYQLAALEVLARYYSEDSGKVEERYRKELKNSGFDIKQIMDFATMVVKERVEELGTEAFNPTPAIDELTTVRGNLALITSSVSGIPVENITVYSVNDPSLEGNTTTAGKAIPGKPTIYLYTQ